MKRTIVLTERSEDWHACLKGRYHGVWGSGKSPWEAVRECRKTAKAHDIKTKDIVEYDVPQ